MKPPEYYGDLSSKTFTTGNVSPKWKSNLKQQTGSFIWVEPMDQTFDDISQDNWKRIDKLTSSKSDIDTSSWPMQKKNLGYSIDD